MRILLGLVLLLAIVAVGCTTAPAAQPEATPTPEPEPEMQDDEVPEPELNTAPDFTVSTISGEQFTLSERTSEGRPVVVYFMASWCTTCAKNWEALNEIVPKYEGQVDFIAVSVDPTDSEEILTNLAEERGFAFDTSPGNAELAVEYNVLKQTAKFAIDAEGNIVERHDGALSTEEWDAFFGQLV